MYLFRSSSGIPTMGWYVPFRYLLSKPSKTFFIVCSSLRRSFFVMLTVNGKLFKLRAVRIRVDAIAPSGRAGRVTFSYFSSAATLVLTSTLWYFRMTLSNIDDIDVKQSASPAYTPTCCFSFCPHIEAFSKVHPNSDFTPHNFLNSRGFSD